MQDVVGKVPRYPITKKGRRHFKPGQRATQLGQPNRLDPSCVIVFADPFDEIFAQLAPGLVRHSLVRPWPLQGKSLRCLDFVCLPRRAASKSGIQAVKPSPSKLFPAQRFGTKRSVQNKVRLQVKCLMPSDAYTELRKQLFS